MKTITCAICGETVTKRQSLNIGDGKRACRKHEETQKKSQTILQSEKELQQKEQLENKKQQEKRRQHGKVDFRPKCLICQSVGLRQDHFYAEWLMQQARFKVTYGREPNILDTADREKIAGALSKCLWFVKWEGKNRKVRLPFDAYQVASILGWFFACDDCCQEHKLVKYTEEKLQETPNLSELLEQAMVFTEGVVMPVFEAVAAKEIAARN